MIGRRTNNRLSERARPKLLALLAAEIETAAQHIRASINGGHSPEIEQAIRFIERQLSFIREFNEQITAPQPQEIRVGNMGEIRARARPHPRADAGLYSQGTARALRHKLGRNGQAAQSPA